MQTCSFIYYIVEQIWTNFTLLSSFLTKRQIYSIVEKSTSFNCFKNNNVVYTYNVWAIACWHTDTILINWNFCFQTVWVRQKQQSEFKKKHEIFLLRYNTFTSFASENDVACAVHTNWLIACSLKMYIGMIKRRVRKTFIFLNWKQLNFQEKLKKRIIGTYTWSACIVSVYVCMCLYVV